MKYSQSLFSATIMRVKTQSRILLENCFGHLKVSKSFKVKMLCYLRAFLGVVNVLLISSSILSLSCSIYIIYYEEPDPILWYWIVGWASLLVVVFTSYFSYLLSVRIESLGDLE